MSAELRTRLSEANDLQMPDLWNEVESRVARGLTPKQGDFAHPVSGRRRFVVVLVAFAVFLAAGVFAWRALTPLGGGSTVGAPGSYVNPLGWSIHVPSGWYVRSFPPGNGVTSGAQFSNVPLSPPISVSGAPPQATGIGFPRSAVAIVIANAGSATVPGYQMQSLPISIDDLATGSAFAGAPYIRVGYFSASGRTFVITEKVGANLTESGAQAAARAIASITQADTASVAPTTPAPPSPVPAVDVTQGGTLHLGQLGGLTAAQDAFGSVWATLITDSGGQELVRVDPVTGEVEHRFPLVYIPAQEWGGKGLAVGDGAVWVAGADAGFEHGTITRIDPVTNTVQTIVVKGHGVADVAFDSGILWALVPQKTPHVAEVVAIDPITDTVVSSTEFQADWYDGVFPAGGSAWTLERQVRGSTVQGGTLVQIVPGSASQITLGGSFAWPASDGTSIWAPYMGDAQAMNLARGIARIDAATGEVLGSWKTDPVGYDLAVGEDGGIWFLAGDHLERLNPSTGETDVDVAVSGKPIFIVPTRGAIWVGTYEGDLIRFDVSDVGS